MVNGQYQVAIPWKGGRPTVLPTNYQMAKKRLQNLEQRLRRDEKVAEAYAATIEAYIQKGYVRKVPRMEKAP